MKYFSLYQNSSFGWGSDGIRGHVFANDDGSILVISIKGTSAGLWGGGQTGEKDKMNDNTLFSCCCAYISRAWTPVCDCFKGNDYICESSCLQDSINHSGLYYDHALVIIEPYVTLFFILVFYFHYYYYIMTRLPFFSVLKISGIVLYIERK